MTIFQRNSLNFVAWQTLNFRPLRLHTKRKDGGWHLGRYIRDWHCDLLPHLAYSLLFLHLKKTKTTTTQGEQEPWGGERWVGTRRWSASVYLHVTLELDQGAAPTATHLIERLHSKVFLLRRISLLTSNFSPTCQMELLGQRKPFPTIGQL